MTLPSQLLHDLEERIGYTFLDVEHLAAALTHASAVEASEPRISERLEFLGDAVLGLALSDLLSERYPEYDEGELSKSRAALVNTASFAAKARELGLHNCLNLGKGEEKTGGREKISILAAVYEAVMGVIFRESGYGAVRTLAQRHFGEAIEQVRDLVSTDAKTQLQEICQQAYRVTPTYRVIEEIGPDHARRFVVSVLLGEEVLAIGEGPSKRTAEQEAARRALAARFPAGRS